MKQSRSNNRMGERIEREATIRGSDGQVVLGVKQAAAVGLIDVLGEPESRA
jgi:hypothetical protein